MRDQCLAGCSLFLALAILNGCGAGASSPTSSPAALPPRDVVLTIPTVPDPTDCFPHLGVAISISGDSVVVEELPDDRVIDFCDGMAPIRVAGRWGYIDSEHHIAIAPRFDRAQRFSEGRAQVEVDGKVGYIDREGDYVVAPRFAWGYRYYRGVAAVELDDRWGLVGLDGTWVVPPKFRRIDLLVGGLKAETFDGESGFVEPDGRFIRTGPLAAFYTPANERPARQ